MARRIPLVPTRTYATEANAIKAVERSTHRDNDTLRYVIIQHSDGRFYPVFIGQTAVDVGVHFMFNVLA